MSTSENRDSQLAAKGVLTDFKDDALAISAGGFYSKMGQSEC